MVTTKLVIIGLSSIVATGVSHVLVYRKGRRDGQKLLEAKVTDEQPPVVQNGMRAHSATR